MVSSLLDNVDRILQKNFEVSEEDVLRSYVKTTGLSEVDFDLFSQPFKVFDTGGQRSERTKWIKVFPQVDLVLFVVSLSEYDQVLVEASDQNRMQETLNLFENLCNSQWFSNTPVVLLFNKADIFVDKIKRVPLARYFPEYDGGEDFESAANFVINLFLKRDFRPGPRKIFAHLLCAIDINDTRTLLLNLCGKAVACARSDPADEDCWKMFADLR